jgi:hypothetical protein
MIRGVVVEIEGADAPPFLGTNEEGSAEGRPLHDPKKMAR